MTHILTGLRANGDFHIGNYLGSMLPMVELQQSLGDADILSMFIADLHSFTTPVDHTELRANIIQNVRMYVAAGLDPKHTKTRLYRQSFVPQHSELAWTLSCFTGFGELSRMVEFKDKSQRLGESSVKAGLFGYPVLMAADILLYDAEYIPLGDDQKQHIELTRTLAERMNKSFDKQLFTVPAAWEKQLTFSKRSESIRIRSLKNPSAKMSKSVSDPKGTIGLLDSPAEARKKILAAETDSVGIINYDWEAQPGITNLLKIGALLSNTDQTSMNQQWVGKNRYGDLKNAVADSVESFLTTFQAKYAAVDEAALLKVLEAGEDDARKQAQKKLTDVYTVLGLR